VGSGGRLVTINSSPCKAEVHEASKEGGRHSGGDVNIRKEEVYKRTGHVSRCKVACGVRGRRGGGGPGSAGKRLNSASPRREDTGVLGGRGQRELSAFKSSKGESWGN